MADDTDNLVLEHLRHIRGRIDTMVGDIADLKLRMTNLEDVIGRGYTALNRRLDRHDERLERIERRLDLADA
ncbi:MAG: hypothetical protein ACR2OV_07445 [Hyphomicrobiaceae bacterium]